MEKRYSRLMEDCVNDLDEKSGASTMRNLINVRCWSRLTYLNILSYRNLWDTRTLGTLTIIFVNIPPGFLCHRRHYRHCTPALTPSAI